LTQELSGRVENYTVSLLNYMGANPEDFTGSVPKITILSAVNLAAAGALMGGGGPEVCRGITARKNSSGRSSLKWFW